MFERFTDRARHVVVLAQEESRLLNHPHIGTEHLLLGLLRDADGPVRGLLAPFGVDLATVRATVVELAGEGAEGPPGHVPFTRRAKTVLELSLREAKRLGHDYIDSEHMLLGLLAEGEGLGVRVLESLGADLGAVRGSALGSLGAARERPAPTPPSPLRGGGLASFETRLAALEKRLSAVEEALSRLAEAQRPAPSADRPARERPDAGEDG